MSEPVGYGKVSSVTVIQKEEKEPEITRYRLLFPKNSYTYVSGGLSGYLDPQGGERIDQLAGTIG